MNQKYRKLVSLMMANKKSNIKYEYVDYIQGDGGQYIDTKFNPQDNSFKATIDLMLTANTNGQTIGIWGNLVFSGSLAKKNSIGIVSNSWFGGQGGTTILGNSVVGIKTKLVFDMINATFTVNDKVSDVQRLTGDSSSAFLFARNNGHDVPYLGANFSGRVYNYILETAEEGVIQHLRPIRLIDFDEYCMRCEITGKIFRNLGERAFIGPSIIDEEIEYIESTDGLPYIDTGFVPRRNSGKTKITASVSNNTNNTMGLYGYIDRDKNISNRITIGCGNNLNEYKWFSGSGITNYLTTVENNEKIEFVWDRKNKTILINNIEYPCLDSDMTELSLSAYLFNRNNNNKPDSPYNFIGRVYSYQELDDVGNLLIDAVPIISNGTYCLKDKVSGSYLYNQGDGKFTGPSSKNSYILTSYTELTGEQWFSLGVKGNYTDETEINAKSTSTLGGFAFGARDSYLVSTQSAFFNISGVSTLVYSGFGERWISRTIRNSDTDGWMYVKQNTNSVGINDKTYSSVNNTQFTTRDDMLLGRIMSDDRCFIGYINIFKLIKNNELIYDLHSCIQTATGLAGFWCFINNRFYGSETAVQFIAGPELDDGNKVELLKLIDLSNQFTESNYTPDSWVNLENKRNNAIEISEKKSLQSEIDDAEKNLQVAISNLTEEVPLVSNYETLNLTLDGTNYEDTGIKLFDTSKDFTLFIDFNIDPSNYVGTQKVLFHCMYEVSPWYGITFQTITDPTTASGEYSVSHNTKTTIVYKPVATNRENIFNRTVMCIRYQKNSDSETQLNIKTFNPTTSNIIDDISSGELIYEINEEVKNSRLILGAADMLSGGITRNTIGSIHKFEYFENYQLTDEQLLLRFFKQIN